MLNAFQILKYMGKGCAGFSSVFSVVCSIRQSARVGGCQPCPLEAHILEPAVFSYPGITDNIQVHVSLNI